VTSLQAVTIDGGMGLDEFNQQSATNTFPWAPLLPSLEAQLP